MSLLDLLVFLIDSDSGLLLAVCNAVKKNELLVVELCILLPRIILIINIILQYFRIFCVELYQSS